MPPKRRRIFLINKPFQYRFTLFVCSWLIALSLAYPLLIKSLFDYFLQYLEADPMGPVAAQIERIKSEVIAFLVLLQVTLIGMSALISIFMSHRIAGPLYKLRRYFVEAAAGNLEQVITFRKGDYFKELATEYNNMMESIRGRLAGKNHSMQAAIEAIEKGMSLDPHSDEYHTQIRAALHALYESRKH